MRRHQSDKADEGSFLPALAVALLGLVLIAGRGLVPGESGRVAAIFPPSADDAAMMRAAVLADARIVAKSGRRLELYSETPGLPGRLRAAGARLVLDSGFAAGCGAGISGSERG